NRDALRPAATLSGGERLRAGLALLTGGATPPQMLIMDEPTNHLDIEAVEMLEAALAGYDGALLIVSHDAPFIEGIGCAREIVLGD
ncbi:MAG TPA: ABC transporter ATP-binding protein, partial [Sphingobium sp.]|nr:ABC transporter ATP-binding protein [Sphingobium sp.]